MTLLGFVLENDAKEETNGDIANEINAASKIAEIHRKYVGKKEEKSNLGNPWKQG